MATPAYDTFGYLLRQAGDLAQVKNQFDGVISELQRVDGYLADTKYFGGNNFTSMYNYETLT